MTFVAVGGGLLSSSVTFAIELVLRDLGWLQSWFPPIDVVTLVRYEKGMLSAGAAVMHFNIAVGLFIILAAHPIYEWCCPRPAATGEKPVWRRPRAWFALAVVIFTLANLRASSALFQRTHEILEDMKNHPPAASTARHSD
jgi:hypothetical protein